ncbi:MAG: orotidine-5'-phosphate decarboxylase [Candidatus Bathyarchaeota archaeon]|jgi:orotidine-5'-phosphate decarboxylase
MEQATQEKGSKIVLSLDPFPVEPQQLLEKSTRILEKVHPYICALKINRQLVLPLGLFDDMQRILKSARGKGLPTIMDCKINDIGNTNRAIAEYYFKAGFDAVTANPFVGWDEGLQPVFEVAKQKRRGVILLVYMSHKGAPEGYGQSIQDPEAERYTPQYIAFVQKALKWKADGAVVGATYPEKIREIHSILKDRVPIFSPGIGAQGGDVKAAVRAGASYLIVGRTIILSGDPAETARNIRDIAQE